MDAKHSMEKGHSTQNKNIRTPRGTKRNNKSEEKNSMLGLGATITKLRTEKDVLQKQLAKHLNVSVGTISNYENGVHSPDLQTLCKIADFYQVSTDYLLQRTSYRHNLDTLKQKIVMDFTADEFINTTLELTERNRSTLSDFLDLILLRNKIDLEQQKTES